MSHDDCSSAHKPNSSNEPHTWAFVSEGGTQWDDAVPINGSSAASEGVEQATRPSHERPSSSTPGFVNGTAEGTVSFPSRPSVIYRYTIEMKNDKVKIWLEDRESKHQWDSGSLSQDEIVTSESVIPHAKLPDYVQFFYNCLSAADGENSSDFQHELVNLPDHQLELQLKLKLRVFTSTWTTSYKFVLFPVALQPYEVLGAKLRDVEDENRSLRSQLEESQSNTTRQIEELQAEMANMKSLRDVEDENRSFTTRQFQELQAEMVNLKSLRSELEDAHCNAYDNLSGVFKLQTELALVQTTLTLVQKNVAKPAEVVFLRATANKMTAANQMIVWTTDEVLRDEDYFTVLPSGSIHFLADAIYDLHISVVNNTNSGEAFQLKKNGEKIRSCLALDMNGHWHTSIMRHILTVMKDDEIAVQYTGNIQAYFGSTLVMNLLARS